MMPFLKHKPGLLAAIFSAAISLSTIASADAPQAIQKGQKYVMATHSFSVFIGPNTWRSTVDASNADDGPLAKLAAERGKTGHEALAVQMIGGSTPMQHWNQGDGNDEANIAKVALRKGGVDVFTLSPNRVIPEQGIDLFGDLVIKTNPNARILAQNSWMAWDGKGTTLRSAEADPARASFTNADRDQVDLATIDGWLADLEAPGGYLEALRKQLAGIDQRAGKEITYVVPSAAAMYQLRKEVIKGNVPGIKKQSELFTDALGHVTQPGINLVTYVWYATMYRENPMGLQALVNPEDPTSAARELLLQKIAWNAVVEEVKSGVAGQAVEL